MSRVYFHSEYGTAEVLGAERHHCAGLVSDALRMALRINYQHAADQYMPFVPTSSYLWNVKPEARVQTFDTWLGGLSESSFIVNGEEWDIFDMALNTAKRLGGHLSLAASIHGQCEIHGWVSGPNRAWLADMIENAREAAVFRPEAGWESAIELLRSRDDGPVVTSYSVCEQFPNAGICKEAGLWQPGPEHQGFWKEEDYPGHAGEPWWDGDEWYDIAPEEQWRMSVEALKTLAPEWSPEQWTRLFGKGHSGFDMNEIAFSQPARMSKSPA